jgi:heparan-alpha-glucosaminide N-acetyltransferase
MSIAPASSLRISSIDILRALTMVLMIFVNDLWSLNNIPGWLEHTAAAEDGMGLADVVFPAFLFIVGMSVPLAINNRRSKGDDNRKIFFHILERGAALLVMGLFLVNGEYLNAAETGISRGLWNVLSCLSFIALWNAWPKSTNPWIKRILKAMAVGILLVLAFICRSGEGENIQRFSTHWWGILGLIGWAYMVGAIVVMLTGNKTTIIAIAWAIFLSICIASHAGLLDNEIVGAIIGPLGVGGHVALVLGGAITTNIFFHYHKLQQHAKMMGILLLIAAALMALGFVLRPYWGISKIRVTPSWILICSGITIITFVLVNWIADQQGKASWFDFIKPAGTNTLLCYLLPYFGYALAVATGWSLPEWLLTGAVGLFKSLAFALLIVGIGGLLGKLGVKLKL